MCIGIPSHGDNNDLGVEDPKKRPKWWHDTIGDVQVGEMIKGRSLRNKGKKKLNTINFALIVNIQGVYEPQVFKEVKGETEWEKAMATKHESNK